MNHRMSDVVIASYRSSLREVCEVKDVLLILRWLQTVPHSPKAAIMILEEEDERSTN